MTTPHHAPPPYSINQRQRTVVAAETAWLQVAATAQLMGENEKAQNALEIVIKQNPYHAGALVRFGHLLHNQQQYMQAAEAYQKAISLVESQGGNNGQMLTTIWASLAHCWLLLDDLPRAFQAYQQALGYPGGARDSSLWFGVGLLYDRYAANEHALEAFSAVIKLENLKTGSVPSAMIRETYYRVGLLLRFRKSYDAALACFEYVSKFPPSPLQKADINLQIAVTFDAKGDLASARSILDSTIVKESRHAVAMRGKSLLGWILVRSGPGGEDVNAEQERGLKMLREVVNEEPGDALAWYYLGRAYVYRKMYTQSYEAYQEAVYRDSQNAAFWNSIGILYLEIHQFRDALDAFSRAIHQNPSISEVWWNLGILYESCNNQISDAIDAYQRAAELDPGNVNIKNRIALRRAISNNTPPPIISTAGVMELDPLPCLTRPILLGTAHIPPQKASPPSVLLNATSTLLPSSTGPSPMQSIAPPLRPSTQPKPRPSMQPMPYQPMRPPMRPGMPSMHPSSMPVPRHPTYGYTMPTRPNGDRPLI